MKEDRIINAMNNLDDDILIDAMSETPAIISAGVRRSRLGRRRLVAIVAAVLIFVLAAGFASGILTAPVSLFNSGKVEETTSHIYYYGTGVDLLGFRTQLASIRQSEIKGQVIEDAKQLFAEKIEKGDLHWHSVTHPDGKTEREYDDYYMLEETVQFDNQVAALDYIGCKYYEKQYFPYDNCLATVSYFSTLKKDSSPRSLDIGCDLSVESIDERIAVKVSVEANWSRETIDVGGKSFFDDGTYALETFTTTNGLNGGKAYKTGVRDGWVYSRIYKEEGLPDLYEIEGFIIKNRCKYAIEISCPWEDSAEANRIFDTWAESF